MINQSPILVTGIPRSGTSIIAAIINQCGVFLGSITKRSMFENVGIKEEIVHPYFVNMKMDPRGQFPLPDTKSLSIPMNWADKVSGMIIEQGYKRGDWMYKSTSMGLIWPVWHYAFPDAKWIIVRRKPSDIVQSCMKTGYMDAYEDENVRDATNVASIQEGWLWWIREYEKRFTEMMMEGVNCKVIWPERMVDGDYQQLHEVLDWLGLRWKEELLNFINPLLWKSRQRKKGG